MAGTIGQELKQARLAKGLSLEDVAHATKIPVPALEAMERGDFSVFSNPTYARSFLRIYSRHLEVDVSKALAALGRPQNGRWRRLEFLKAELDLTPLKQTIPIVKHRVIEMKPKRSATGGVLFVLLAMMIPAVYYAGKWSGIRDFELRKKAELEVPCKAAPEAAAGGMGEALRARVILPAHRDGISDSPPLADESAGEVRVLTRLDAPAGSHDHPGR